jgi:quinol monooxygenase YgiN
MIGIVVRFDVTDEAAARRFDELTATVLEGIRAHEPGTLVYATQRLSDEPLARVFVEVYADDAALQAHEDAAHVREFHERKAPLLSRAPRVEMVEPGPAKGLEAVLPG